MSGTGTISTVIPAPSAPLVDEQRNITVPWRAYFLVMQRRSGGTAGVSTSDNAQALLLERTARINADQALQAAIDAADAAWQAAVDAEEAARIAGDQLLNTLLAGTTNQLQAEIIRATQAEALLVPLDDLCWLWSQCDFSFLPTTDPGSGRAWNDAGHLAIGSGTTLVDLGLEDASGTWLLEDASGSWQFG